MGFLFQLLFQTNGDQDHGKKLDEATNATESSNPSSSGNVIPVPPSTIYDLSIVPARNSSKDEEDINKKRSALVTFLPSPEEMKGSTADNSNPSTSESRALRSGLSPPITRSMLDAVDEEQKYHEKKKRPLLVTFRDSFSQHSMASLASQLSDWSKELDLKKTKTRRKRSMEHLNKSVLSSTRRLNAHFINLERRLGWLRSLQHLDPRFQILMYFEEVARHGGALADPLAPPSSIALLRGFAKAAAFTVWRPTSREAICKMMRGEVTGKGLDVKGKSAKCGKLSGLVPFLQIHNNEDKKKAAWPPARSRIRIFYKNATLRNIAEKVLNSTMSGMQAKYTEANVTLHSIRTFVPVNDADKETAFENLSLKIEESVIRQLNGSGYGLDVPERVFFEAYINKQDITRDGSEYESGRPSEPAFQDMNGACVRKYKGSGPRAVVLQTCLSEALRPQSLVVAYEEDGCVTPVASDFDCFILGTRGVVYDSPLPDDQVELTKRFVGDIQKILENPGQKSWTSRWLEVLKDNAVKGLETTVPEYGFGDPKSYDIVKGAVSQFVHKNKNGAVRHGAECFNYVFPQELDDHFLIISDSLPGKIPWKYVDGDELKDILCARIDEGFCFPLNPKWILADKGWKKVYDKMMESKDETVQRSLDSWYPRESGIRDKIEAIHARFPNGFETVGGHAVKTEMEGMEAMNLAEDELRRYLIIRRAKMKLKAALMFGKIGGAVLRRKNIDLRDRYNQQLINEKEDDALNEKEDDDLNSSSKIRGGKVITTLRDIRRTVFCC